MNHNQRLWPKLKAFTLMEVLVATIVSGLVVMAGYYLLQINQQQAFILAEAKEKSAQLEQLDLALSSDLLETQFYELLQDGCLLIKKDSARVEYRLDKEGLFREAQFRFQSSPIEDFYPGVEAFDASSNPDKQLEISFTRWGSDPVRYTSALSAVDLLRYVD